MTKKFTASEVRAEIAGMQCAIDNAGFGPKGKMAFASYVIGNIGKWKRIAAILADRLEADEKGKPVADYDPRASFTVPIDTTTLQRNATHQAPADTERLAEAVRNGLIDALRHQRKIDEDGAEVGVSREAIDDAADILSALAAQENPND